MFCPVSGCNVPYFCLTPIIHLSFVKRCKIIFIALFITPKRLPTRTVTTVFCQTLADSKCNVLTLREADSPEWGGNCYHVRGAGALTIPLQPEISQKLFSTMLCMHLNAVLLYR